MVSFKWWSLLIVISAIASQYVLSTSQYVVSIGGDSMPIGLPTGTHQVAYALTHPNIQCNWKVYVQTGNMYWAGTDAVVSLKIYDKSGDNITVSNLQRHGMAPGNHANYDYFERGHKDVFTFKQRCLKYNICKVKLSHNNGGDSPGWFLNYIIVQDGPDPDYSKPHRFDFNRWIDSDYGLSATINLCKS